MTDQPDAMMQAKHELLAAVLQKPDGSRTKDDLSGLDKLIGIHLAIVPNRLNYQPVKGELAEFVTDTQILGITQTSHPVRSVVQISNERYRLSRRQAALP